MDRSLAASALFLALAALTGLLLLVPDDVLMRVMP